VDWINGRLTVERGIVGQQVDDVKTAESRKKLAIDAELLDALKTWKQAGQFSAAEHWMFASPGSAWQIAVVLRSSLARVPKGGEQGRNRQAWHTQPASHVQVMAGFGWYSGGSAAKVDAALGHPNHHETFTATPRPLKWRTRTAR
jgi:hypothetical protein